VNGTQAQKLGVLVQLARGHCSAHSPAITGTPIYEPLDTECDCKQGGVNCGENPQNNRARLGGIDHSSGAVVGPSRYLTNAPWSTRPVVAYAAGLDGMVHAFYVSGSTAWTSDGKTLPAGVVRGQELWAFVPPGQVCGIATNTAMVDGSLNVIDVFGDFPTDANNDGVIDWTSTSEKPDKVREWRTLLIASAGLGGSELFALDVTNPLKPVLLWHVGGATEKDGRFDLNRDGQFVSGEVFSKSNQTTFALKWFEWDDDDEDGTTAYIPTDYNVSDSTAAGAAVIEAIKFGRYDYRNMGLAYSAPVAKVWMGNSFQYVVFLATSAADHTSATPTGFRGVEVFAIDAISGEKVWQWEHLYANTDASGIDNGIPPAVALGDITANGSTERIYVGDMEGRLWELSARDGRNLNYLKGSDGKFWSFPLYGTPVMAGTGADDATKALYTVSGGGLGQQPLTTPIGQGRFTEAPALTSSFDPALLVGRLAMIVGTMGVDWSIAPYERGHLYVIPAYPAGGTRLEPPIDVNAARNPKRFGIVLPKSVWDVPLDTGERVYGMPRVANNTIVFNTAFGSFAGDISGSFLDSGNLKLVSSTSTDTRANESKSFGGAVIIGGSVVITTDSHIRVLANPPASLSQASTAQSTFNRSTPSVVKSWEPVSK
jgi:type IV pilus assembly protein PilY1